MTLNFTVKRFCNYLIINLAKHHKFILEVGIVIEDKSIEITLKSRKENFTQATNALLEIFDVPGLHKSELDLLGVKFSIKNTFKKFSKSFIASQSLYYFIPEKTTSPFIYKYMPVDLNLFKLLINNQLWFSDPNSFNDPFDSRYCLEADPQDKEIAQFYFTESKKTFGNENISLNDFIKTFNPPPKQKFLDDLEAHHFKNSLAKKFGVCCFSEKYDNHLLWSHYSDNCKGVSLVFDWRMKNEPPFHAFTGDKVKYRASIISKFYDATGNLDVTDILFSKYKDWEYEHEVRELQYFDNGTTNRAVPFFSNCLVGIILGPRISFENKQTIENLVKQLAKYKLEIIESSINLSSHTITIMKNNLSLK